ncbi:hypothetical protein Tsubulata_033016 [Turnera subulata]|uniref:WEB family protein n=1 Tax=Turnera subulata TaxID=218843 RepID=A0A9Q0FHZ6_9ROSI|nr:hypothetical protein Tsubulata_033016 [Turnera subulata]
MVNIFGRSDHQRVGSNSPRGEVGEIDTRAPFQSVKAAVSLFGEVALARGRAAIRTKSKLSSENILDKETQLLLAQKEVNKYKKQLEGDEATKKRVNSDLQIAKRTLNELTTKLRSVSESKEATVEAAEAIKQLAKELEAAKSQKHSGNAARKEELDLAREQYKLTASELDIAKQQLTEMRQDFDAALEAKWAAFQQAGEARRAANMSTERATELSKEIKAMRESAQQVKLAATQSQEQQAKIVAEKDARISECKLGVEATRRTLQVLKKEYDPDVVKHLESRLEEITAEIDFLQEEMKKAHASEMDAVKVVTSELNEATKTLQKISEEESSYRDIVTLLRWELENVKAEQAALLKKQAEEEDDLNSALKQLWSEAEKSRQEVEELKKTAREMKQEAEKATLLAEEEEEKLKLLLLEAEKAKAAEERALDEMKSWSERAKIKETGSHGMIRVSLDEYTSMKKKVEELEDITRTKEADAMAELQTINARQAELAVKLGASLKAIEEIQQATVIAIKSAEMAEAAHNVVEGELLKRRNQGQVTS